MNNDKESAAAAYEKGIDVFATIAFAGRRYWVLGFYMMGLDYWH